MPVSGHEKLPAHSGKALLPPAPSIAQPFGGHLEFGLNPRTATSESVLELDPLLLKELGRFLWKRTLVWFWHYAAHLWVLPVPRPGGGGP